MDCQEIRRVGELGDQRQFMLDEAAHLVRQAVRVALARALPSEARQLLVGRAAVGHQIGAILVAQLVEAERAALGNLDRAGNRVLIPTEQAPHLVGRLQVALGIGGQAIAGVADRAVLADAGQHVLQRPPPRVVGVDVVGGDERRPASGGQIGEGGQPPAVATAITVTRSKVTTTLKDDGEFLEMIDKSRVLCIGREDDEQLPLAIRNDVGAEQPALGLFDPPLAQGQQAGEAGIGGSIGRQAQQRRAVLAVQAYADDQADAGLLGGDMGSHDAGQRVAVGDRDGTMAQVRGRLGQLLRVRGAAQEREVRGDLKLDVIGHRRHPKRPCRYHCGAAPPPSEPGR